METILLVVIISLIVIVGIIILTFRPKEQEILNDLPVKVQELQSSLSKIENNLKDDFRTNREENANIAKENRTELNETLKDFRAELSDTLKNITEQSQSALKDINKTLSDNIDSLISKIDEKNKENRESSEKAFRGFSETFDKNVSSFNELQREKFTQLENKQNELIISTEKKLESIRVTVEEKLEKTLSERLGQSFETVGKQLIEVQKGLGEMQTLAQDVGGLKKVLSNVKMRGGIGEVQLAMLLEQVLAPEQYQANVKTKESSNDVVEFAIKLPGRGTEENTQVWLPVDAKFPKDVYEQLQTAYDNGDLSQIEQAQKNLDNTIRKMAKDIGDKYIDPPNTTDFGIMFLPFEGIYAEVVRKASLLEDLQRNFKIVVTGPTTLAAILNSLQMGFKTLAIQKRSSEVWNILGAVKKEFDNFAGLIDKAQKNIQTGLDQLDDVRVKRTKAIQRKLRSVEVLNSAENSSSAKTMLKESDDGEVIDDENIETEKT
jgi:DNA recombination protein RmuC